MTLEARQDYAPGHPLRLNILALAEKRHQSLDSEDLRRELPERPAVAVIEYHLLVLRQVGLLPPDRHAEVTREKFSGGGGSHG